MGRKIGFDNDKYIKTQSEKIAERIANFGDKLYLEMGGKLFDDFHASRVLPGFLPDTKIKMLMSLKDRLEIVIAINAKDIVKNKIRGDYNITYDMDTLRLIDAFRSIGLLVESVVITHYAGQSSVDAFKSKLEKLGMNVFLHYPIEGYPTNIELIVSEEGFGRNEYITTTRPLVVVTAPGPGSGKMATCLSQLYHENKRGVKAGYAKFETFPVWNLPLNHPVNLAYEAATADLNDINMVDSFHLEAYGKTTVNYNRDIEVFPVLNAIFEKIMGESPYKSPTDMGVNMAGYCIFNDEAVSNASKDEIIRRYYQTACDCVKGCADKNAVVKTQLIMKQAKVTTDNRKAVKAALEKAESTSAPAVAIELNDGRIVTGKTSSLLGASSAALLNALKCLAGIDDGVKLISPEIIEPVQNLKVKHLKNHNPRLHTDEVLIALSICATMDETAGKALDKLDDLYGAQAHSTVVLSQVDHQLLKKLGIDLTQEPKYQGKKLYHK